MKQPAVIFVAQALNHLIWYASMRAAVARNVGVTVVLDALYAVLLLTVLKKMETSNWVGWAALLCGGAVGTYLGLTVTV